MPSVLLDHESAAWLRDLRAAGPEHDAAVTRLHELCLRVAYSESARRRSRLPERVVGELDDICMQATDDAVMLVLRKLDGFRLAARFTTWACKFVILELSTRLRRQTWRERTIVTDDSVWERLRDAAPPSLRTIEHRETINALERAVRDRLTERQRMIFQAAALDDVPIDVLAERLSTTRGAIYKTLHDSRRVLRDVLADGGHWRD